MSSQAEFPSYRLAGFLKARGVKFLGTRQQGKQTLFSFEGGPKTDALITAYTGSPEYDYDNACKAMHDLTQIRRSES